MKALSIIVLLSTFCAIKTKAQQSINAAGGNVSTAAGSVSYSIGQLVFSNTISSTGAVSEGVQQPFEIYSLSNGPVYEKEAARMYIYPNPTSSFITLNIHQSYSGEFHYQLCDEVGHLLETRPVTDAQTNINMNDLPAATYFILVKEFDLTVQSFKVIKNN